MTIASAVSPALLNEKADVNTYLYIVITFTTMSNCELSNSFLKFIYTPVRGISDVKGACRRLTV